ncbi:MAG: DUF1289 domain-containing protein [Melioribacteraceae bacterium]
MWLMRVHDENTIEIKSPCNGDCFIDNSNKLCEGCYRTMDEIISWCSMDDKEKEEVMIKVEARRKQSKTK